MSTLNSELKLIAEKFEHLNQAVKLDLLKYQYAWQDWKMQSIFQSEYEESIRNGGNYYPVEWIKKQDIKLTDEEIWQKQSFTIIITEWVKVVPKYRFEKIGDYLTFIKSVYCEQLDFAFTTLKGENSKALYDQIDDSNFPAWMVIKKYFCYKGNKAIEMNQRI